MCFLRGYVMRYLALATDYDGTLATDGWVDEPTLEALGRLRDSGRRLILVTGRELDELLGVFPRVDLFERVIAENGALLYRPASREVKPLGESAPEALIEAMRRGGAHPISVGRVISLALSRRILLASSSSFFRSEGRFLPARLMKY